MKSIVHFIDGKLIRGEGTRKSAVYNPATGKQIAEVSFANQQDINLAVESASLAFSEWKNVTPARRARMMFQFKMLLEEHIDELAALITAEHGKTLSDAKGEIQRGIEVVEFACGAPQLLKGEFSENVGSNIDCYSFRQPFGVCVGITPFNFPAMVPLWMFPVALVCGNTFILKPSEKNSSVSLRLAELLKEAELPDGVFNIVQGDKEVVDALIEHPKTAVISFVGSTPIAKYIYETSAKHGKHVQALAGAKNHCMIMPDADLDQAVNGIMGAAYGSAGERCMAISVVIAIGDQVADNVAEKLKQQIKQLKVLSGDNPKADMGPLISKQHLEKVCDYIADGIKEGAHLIVDGRKIKIDGYENGYFLGATLFDHVSTNMKIYKEEIFGPVLCILRVPDFASAIKIINEHAFGNGVAIYTNDGAIAREFVNQIKVGMVGINVPIPVPVAYYSFGGWKQSRFGDDGVYGQEGIRFYTQLKTITARWTQPNTRINEFSMPTD